MDTPQWISLREHVTGTGAAESLDLDARRALLAGHSRLWSLDWVTEEESPHWVLHRGDLAIDGNVRGDLMLVVDGDLTIGGNYLDGGAPIGIVIVLGNLRVRHLSSYGTLAVTGSLHAEGLIHTHYNDFTFEVLGEVHGRALIIDDKDARYGRDAVTVESRVSMDGHWQGIHPARMLVPEIMATAFENEISGGYLGEDYGGAHPDSSQVETWLHEGKDPFREELAPASLMDAVQAAIDEATEEDALGNLREVDPLVDALVDARLALLEPPPPDLPPSPGEVAALVASDSSDRRSFVARRDGLLSAAQLAHLAKDPVHHVRIAVARNLEAQWTWNARRTASDEELRALAAGLAGDEEIRVRHQVAALLPVDDQLERVQRWHETGGDAGQDDGTSGLRNLARATREPEVHARLLEVGLGEVAAELAGNPSISTEIQRGIAALAPPFDLPKEETDDEADRRLMAVGVLLESPTLDPALALDFAERSVAPARLPYDLRAAWTRHVVPTDELLDVLERVRDKDVRYEWPDIVARCPTASRARLEAAFTPGRFEEPDLEAFKGLGDDEFWRALAASEDPDLRAAAFRNIHVPADAIRAVADTWDDPEDPGPFAHPHVSPLDLNSETSFACLRGYGLIDHPKASTEHLQRLMEDTWSAGDPQHRLRRVHRVLAVRRLAPQPKRTL